MNKSINQNEEPTANKKLDNPSLPKDGSKKFIKSPDFESLIVEKDKNDPLEVGIDMDINKPS